MMGPKWPIDEIPLNARAGPHGREEQSRVGPENPGAGHQVCPYGCGTAVKDMAKLDGHKDARQLMRLLGATEKELEAYS